MNVILSEWSRKENLKLRKRWVSYWTSMRAWTFITGFSSRCVVHSPDCSGTCCKSEGKNTCPALDFQSICQCPLAKLSSSAWLNWFSASLEPQAKVYDKRRYCKSHVRVERGNNGELQESQCSSWIFQTGPASQRNTAPCIGLDSFLLLLLFPKVLFFELFIPPHVLLSL